MTKIVALNCAGCGSSLDIKPEMTTFACGYCGVSQVVERSGGTISLNLIGETLQKVQVGTDKTAAELALKRLAKELDETESNFASIHRKKSEEHRTTLNIFGVLWIALVLISILIAASGTLGYLLGWLLFFGGSICLGILYSRERSKIDMRFKPIEGGLFRRGNDLKDKIAKNRLLVD